MDDNVKGIHRITKHIKLLFNLDSSNTKII